MTRTRALVGALFFASALGGCRQVLGLDEREVGATELTADNYVLAAARAFCEGIEPCCSEHDFRFDGGACETVLAGDRQADLSDALRAGAAFNAEAAAECLRLTTENARACVTTFDEDIVANRACSRVFRSTKVAGEPCESDLECAMGLREVTRCQSPPNSQSNDTRCVVLRDGIEGDPCTDDDPIVSIGCQARDGLRCDDLGSKRCVRLGVVGAACVYSSDCLSDLYCKTQQCVPREGVGTTCTPLGTPCGPGTERECLDACTAGLRCDKASSTCAEALPDGAVCTNSDDCIGGYCNTTGFNEPGVCELLGLNANLRVCGGAPAK